MTRQRRPTDCRPHIYKTPSSLRSARNDDASATATEVYIVESQSSNRTPRLLCLFCSHNTKQPSGSSRLQLGIFTRVRWKHNPRSYHKPNNNVPHRNPERNSFSLNSDDVRLSRPFSPEPWKQLVAVFACRVFTMRTSAFACIR